MHLPLSLPPPYLATTPPPSHLSPLYRVGRTLVCVRERGVTNRFDPLNEGELFTRFRPAMQSVVASLLAVDWGRAGNDSEVKHSCGPSVRTPGDRCVFGSR